MTDNAKLSELIYHSFTALDSAKVVSLSMLEAKGNESLVAAITGARAATYAIHVATLHKPILGNMKTDRAVAAMEHLTAECLKREPVEAEHLQTEALTMTAILSLCLVGKTKLDLFLAELAN